MSAVVVALAVLLAYLAGAVVVAGVYLWALDTWRAAARRRDDRRRAQRANLRAGGWDR